MLAAPTGFKAGVRLPLRVCISDSIIIAKGVIGGAAGAWNIDEGCWALGPISASMPLNADGAPPPIEGAGGAPNEGAIGGSIGGTPNIPGWFS